jgi:hypothetical protein
VRRPTYRVDYIASNILIDSQLLVKTTVAFSDTADPTITLMLTGNQDNFYYHEIVYEPDKDMFITAMKEEIESHNSNRNWIPILCSELPQGTKVIPSVWAMRRKQRHL